MATLTSGFESYCPEQIRAALPFLSIEERRELADALEAKESAEIDERCSRDPLHWAQEWTKTENPKYLEMGLPFKNPFPRKGYFVPLFETFRTSRRLLCPKTRDMCTSWAAMVWATHQAQWRSAFAIVQSMKDTKAQELVEYAAILWREQPEFLKARHPLDGQTKNEMRWAKNGGRIMGVPAGENQIRTFHPTIWICDEIAFIPEAEECWNAVHAAGTPQMIGISSAGPGWMAEQCQSRVTPEAASVIMRAPDPEPEPEPEAEKTLDEQIEEERQRIMNPVDPALALFVQRRNEQQARRSSWQHSSGAYSSVPPPAMHPAHQEREIRQLEEAAAESYGKRKR